MDEESGESSLRYFFSEKPSFLKIRTILNLFYRKLIFNPASNIFRRLRFNILKLINPPFKIGIISYYYPSDYLAGNNGVAIHTYYLARELAKLGGDIHVFTKGEKAAKKIRFLGKGRIITHKISTGNKKANIDVVANKRLDYFIFDNKVMSEVTLENSRTPFKVIHTHGYLTSGAFLAKHLNNLKWVHTFHALEKNRLKFMSKEEKKYFSIIKWMESTVKDTNAVICVSRALKQEVSKAYGIRENKIFYIPNGVNFKLFNTDNRATSEQSVVYVGRFSIEKGIDIIPKIASKVLKSNQEAKFIIVADDSRIPDSLIQIQDKIQKLAEEYPERLIWHRKPLGRKELSNIYKKSTIGIQPSRYESFGLCVLEEMACGNIVICTDVGGLPEVVGNVGIITSFNSNSIANRILFLLKDEKLRRKLMIKSVKWAKQFDWESVAKKVFELYQIVTREPKKEKPAEQANIMEQFEEKKDEGETKSLLPS